MKKCLFIYIAMLTGVACFAQFEKNTIKIGGELEIFASSSQTDNSNAQRDNSEVGFSLGPHAGFFLCESFCVGGGIFIGYDVETDYEYPLGSEVALADKRIRFGIAPGAEYFYGFGEKKKIGLSARGNLSWTMWSGSMEEYRFGTNTVEVSDYLTNTIGIYAVPGLFYRPTPCLLFGLTFGGFRLGYDFTVTHNTTADYKDKSHNFIFGGSLDQLWFVDNTVIGVSYVLGKKGDKPATDPQPQ